MKSYIPNSSYSGHHMDALRLQCFCYGASQDKTNQWWTRHDTLQGQGKPVMDQTWYITGARQTSDGPDMIHYRGKTNQWWARHTSQGQGKPVMDQTYITGARQTSDGPDIHHRGKANQWWARHDTLQRQTCDSLDMILSHAQLTLIQTMRESHKVWDCPACHDEQVQCFVAAKKGEENLD